MKALEDFLRPTQETLFKRLQKMFEGNAIPKTDDFLLVPGESPVLLIAHLDTVHKNPVKVICRSEQGNILMSPQGIGGDDRCGVYGIVKIHESSAIQPWLLFTCDEETGAHGAYAFCRAYRTGALPQKLGSLKMLIELDRKGKNDAVYYGCANPEFEAYITGKGFRTAEGSFSDISVIAPELGIAAVNLSCGYYHAHTLHEYINRRQLKATVRRVTDMVSDAAQENFPRYEYIDAYDGLDYLDDFYGGWYRYGNGISTLDTGIPKDLPEQYKGIYEELLDIYDPVDLALYRRKYGDRGLWELYSYEFGAG